MTISATYITLQRQIADEIGDRQDLMLPLDDSHLALSPIRNAINSAIAKWEREPFYFNAAYLENAFNTVKGQEFYSSADYAAIATIPAGNELHVLVNANRYTLNQRTWQYLQEISVNPAVTGQPVDVAYFAERLRFYPIPDGVYPITWSAYERKAQLVEDTDSNVWTTDAFDLIRSEAKLILAQEVLHDPELSAEMKTAIYGDPAAALGGQQNRGYLYALKAETTRRQARGRVRPTYF